jgi:RNA polymerase sigma factor (sigma-70 family)
MTLQRDAGGRSLVSTEPSDETTDLDDFAVRYRATLLRMALGMCRDRAGAEDLVQDTLVRLLRYPSSFQRARSPLAYARTVMVRVFLDEYASRQPPVADLDRIVNLADATRPDAFAQLDAVAAAVDMVAGLPPKARAVLTLRYVEDLDDRTIARLLGMRRATVRVIAHRALRALSVSRAADDDHD